MKKILIGFLILLISLTGFACEDLHLARIRKPKYLEQSFGTFDNKSKLPLASWPVVVQSIGHTNASYQDYGGTPYFHHGLDIRANDLEKVYASRGGKVVNVENYVLGNGLYWEVAILDNDGFIWQYHHIEKSSIPQKIKDAFKVGSSVPDGELLGAVVHWPVVTYGERYNHIHLNVLDKNKNYISPFKFLNHLTDTIGPIINKIGIYKNKAIHNSTKVSGGYTIFLDASDLVLHKEFIVPPHLIKYRINQGEWVTTWDFSTLPGGADNEKYVDNFFIPNLACGNYSCRKIIIDLGFMPDGHRQFPSNPGQYKIEVEVSDFVNNVDSQSFNWSVE